MPSFFESFPVILVDERGTVRADQPFRRAESRYALERMGVSVTFSGGALDGLQLTNSLVTLMAFFEHLHAAHVLVLLSFYNLVRDSGVVTRRVPSCVGCCWRMAYRRDRPFVAG